MRTVYTHGTRKKLLKVLEARAPKYGRLSKARQRAKADAILCRPVPIESLGAITESLADFAYAVIGGHAVALHGHPRMTQDIDILVHRDDAERAARVLGGHRRTPLAIGGYSVRVKGVPVDIVAMDQPWVQAALDSAQHTVHGNVISKPYLIVMKLFAMRGEQDDTDVVSLLRGMLRAERKATRKLIEQCLPADLDDFDSMVRLAEM